jgi:hypothetical protein
MARKDFYRLRKRNITIEFFLSGHSAKRIVFGSFGPDYFERVRPRTREKARLAHDIRSAVIQLRSRNLTPRSQVEGPGQVCAWTSI